jgi:hypothetical protein
MPSRDHGLEATVGMGWTESLSLVSAQSHLNFEKVVRIEIAVRCSITPRPSLAKLRGEFNGKRCFQATKDRELPLSSVPRDAWPDRQAGSISDMWT